jgi:hypothetical protein
MNIAVESPEVGPACKSAWRPDADRRAKALIQQAAKGLILGSDAYSMIVIVFMARQSA